MQNDEIVINKVSFNDVESFFSIVWREGHELYWYQKVWGILESKGLTAYSSQLEYAIVIIRAITLSMLYEEFCQLAFDEHCEYEGYWDAVYDMIPDIVIGQLYARLAEADYTEDLNYAPCMRLWRVDTIGSIRCSQNNNGDAPENLAILFCSMG